MLVSINKGIALSINFKQKISLKALFCKISILLSFAGYSVEAAISYSWNFLICIKFCKIIESSSLLCAVGLSKVS